MKGILNYSKSILSIILLIFSFYINYYFANKGLYPIDTFSFFDSGFYITEGQHPIKDFWVISGIFIDYVQAAFFLIFGKDWNSYIYHSSFFNSIVSLFFFFFMNQFNKNIFHNFFLSISVSILCYPVVGTPFPYQHSLILSIISLLVFYLAVEEKSYIYWLILPLLMSVSFLSMQLPSGFINLFIIIFSTIYLFYFEKNFLKYFIIGILLSLLLFFLYLIITKVNIKDFFYQIILFPLSVGEGRILGDESAFESAKLLNKLTLRGTLGHFKFINFFILINIILSFLHFKKNIKGYQIDKIIFLNVFIVFCFFSFIFHQLITANQTFIFCLIPISCGLTIIQIQKTQIFKENKLLINIFLIVTLFSTFKYHQVYNEKRKFLDLQNISLSNTIRANKLDLKFDDLKWVTPTYFSLSPKEELDLLKNSIKILKKDKSEKMLITHYQFISLILDENLNIPNRWYFPNNTFPSSNQNKYYKIYLQKFHKKIKTNLIKSIYILETSPGEFDFLKINDLVDNNCFKKEKLNEIFYKVKLFNCSR